MGSLLSGGTKVSHSYYIMRIWKEGSSRCQIVSLKLFHRETCSVWYKFDNLALWFIALATCEIIGQERQIIIIICNMYIPLSWLNCLRNNFFSFSLHSTFVTSCTLDLCCLCFYSILYLCLLTFFSILSILGLFFLSTIIGRSVWYLVFGMHNYLRPSDCPCVFCEVFLCITLHRNLPGSLVSLWKNYSLSRCHVSLLFKLSVLWVIEWDFFKVSCVSIFQDICV